ncbi:MAG: DUF615 domain-containing protein, partial [Gammaproteobacteria bacterium]|nr:DUF615 domain-containing protein [Gammaproteobacteria bacterium]
MHTESEQDKHDDVPLSKSELKRQMTAIQVLGEKLVKLSAAQLETFDIPSNLRHAIDRAKHITKREGLRREMQYIGKLMRHIDIAPIEDFFSTLNNTKQEANEAFHEIEIWRDKLLQDPKALTEFIGKHPNEDHQTLRQIIRNHHNAKTDAQRKKYYRMLFQ